MNLESISFGRLFNTEHLSLVQKLTTTLRKHIGALPELQALCSSLETLVVAEAKAFEILSGSEFTDQKAEADRARDSAARHLAHYVQSFEFSDEAPMVAAALRLKELLKEIPAMVEEAYERETVKIDSLVARLREEPYAAALEELGGSWLVNKLVEKNVVFNAVSKQQTVTDSAKDSGNVNIARKPVDVELHRIFRVIEGRFDLKTAGSEVQTCVNEMNYDIREAETKMKHRLTVSKNTGTDTSRPK